MSKHLCNRNISSILLVSGLLSLCSRYLVFVAYFVDTTSVNNIFHKTSMFADVGLNSLLMGTWCSYEVVIDCRIFLYMKQKDPYWINQEVEG